MGVLLLWLYLAGRCAAQQGAVEEAMQLARQGQLREAAALLTTWTRQQPGDAEAQYHLRLAAPPKGRRRTGIAR